MTFANAEYAGNHQQIRKELLPIEKAEVQVWAKVEHPCRMIKRRLVMWGRACVAWRKTPGGW